MAKKSNEKYKPSDWVTFNELPYDVKDAVKMKCIYLWTTTEMAHQLKTFKKAMAFKSWHEFSTWLFSKFIEGRSEIDYPLFEYVDSEVKALFHQVWKSVEKLTGCHAILFNTRLKFILHELQKRIEK